MVEEARMDDERRAVRELAEVIGYGRVMQLCEELWRDNLTAQGLQGGEITTGPCASAMVPCRHPVRDANGHCEVCCGAGRVTRWVSDNLPSDTHA